MTCYLASVDVTANVFDRLRKEVVDAIFETLQKGSCRIYGSMCSGSGMEQCSIDATVKAALSRGLDVIDITCAFKADIKPSNRVFLHRVFPKVPLMFGDILLFSSGEAPDYLNDLEPTRIPTCNLLFAGFPCKDYSGLNTNAVVDSGGNSFKCLRAIIDYLRNHPECIMYIGENVVRLLAFGRINEIKNEFTAIGFTIQYWVIDCKDLGSPQARERVFLLCLRITALQVPVEVACNVADEVVSRGKSPPHARHDLREYLDTSQDHAATVEYLRECRALPLDKPMAAHISKVLKPPAKKAPKRTWWELDKQLQPIVPRDSVLKPLGDQVRTGSIKSFEAYPALRRLCFQRLNIVMTEAPILPERHGRLIECGQSQGRHQPKDAAKCMALIPQGALFETSMVREILGFEKLRIMGMKLDASMEASFPNAFLNSLAGNAFDANCCNLVLLAGFAALGVK